MKNKELRDLSIVELQEKLEVEFMRLVKLKISHTVSPLENTNVLKEARKNVARLNTEIRHMQIISLRESN